MLQLVFFFIISSHLGLAHSAVDAQSYRSLEGLYEGNKRFRNTTWKRAVVAELVEDSPSFMFLGCTDNRLSPAAIFQAPIGSVVTHNNIGNQYSKEDASTDASVTYAVEELGVQHIIVLGHYGCTGVSKAITGAKGQDSVSKWISPIVKQYKKERRVEVVKFRDSRMPRRGLPNGITDAPDKRDPGFRALVEQNVKRTVGLLRKHSIFANGYEVYVHGFIFDPDTGNVADLKVSFGPPGKPIPLVPFVAVAAAKNFLSKGAKSFRGKTLPGPVD